MGRVVGTCSRCSGPVMIPDPWWGVVPPKPKCASCGAVAAQPYGPVIPMETRRPRFSLEIDWTPKQSRQIEFDSTDPGIGKLEYVTPDWSGWMQRGCNR
jgi:hypothetical protein